MAFSPMMKHYLSIKKLYPDAIIFYRLGDFYEMFSDDAIKASQILDLTLTKRNCGDGQTMPMCGVPAKAVETYLARLVKAGEKVAICEQLTEPKPGQIVDRDIIRVVTPGTIIEDELLDATKNNYVLSIGEFEDKLAASWVDITTGEFVCSICEDENELLNKISITNASEVLCSEQKYNYYSKLIENKGISTFLTICDEIDLNYAKELIIAKFGIDGKKMTNTDTELVLSAGLLLDYINKTQKRTLDNVYKLKIEQGDYMIIDAVARKNLELTEVIRDRSKKGSLLGVIDQTKTSMGARLLRKNIEKPLQSIKVINQRLDATKELIDDLILREQLKDYLSKIKDCERLSSKIAYMNATPRDIENIGISLTNIGKVKNLLSNLKSKIIVESIDKIADFSQVCDIISKAIKENAPISVKDGDFIKDGFNSELDSLRNCDKDSMGWLRDYEAKEREETGIKTLKVGYNRVFGYYIEVPKSQKENVQFRYIPKQTLANNERYTTNDLMQLESYILGAKEKSLKLEKEIFEQIFGMLKDNLHDIQLASESIALIDMLNSFAFVSAKYNYCKPKLSDSTLINIEQGRHPVVEILLKDELFVPNDCFIDSADNRTMIITGPNMAGKSTYMRQIALIVIMAHIGCFVPAKKAEICLVDRIFTRIGASDDLTTGQSTFMVEMNEVANILNCATSKSLILLDEIGRGTSTFDGLSIAWAVIEYFSKTFKSKTLFSTHFHELTEMEGRLDGVKNYRINVKEYNGKIIFLRKIVRGSANKSFGIEVSALAGLPQEVIVKAKSILKELEKNDINSKKIKGDAPLELTEESNVNSAEIINTIKEINLEIISPMEAFMILGDLKEKCK